MNLGPREVVILLIVVLVLFGAKRLPDSARSLGRSMRIFKSEMKEMKDAVLNIATGMIGAPESIAIRAIPVLPL